MELKSGYKQTEVGIIPEDWEASKIGELAFVTKLAGFEYTLHFDYSKSGPVIAVRALNIKNGTLDLTEVHTIPRKTSNDLPRSKLVKGDLVISYVGTLGRVAMIPEDNKFHLAPNVAKICVDQGQVAPEFLAQFLNSFIGQKLIFDAAASTTQAALSMGNLRGIVFTRPPLPEQRAIATALSDVDALLSGLDRLIAKKRDLKQAAMQQLLTGQTRLPGDWVVKSGVKQSEVGLIPEDWDVLPFKEQFDISAGGDVNPKLSSSVQDEEHCYPIYSNALTDRGLYGFCSYADHPANSITITARGTLGFATYRDHKYTAIGRVLVLRPKRNSAGAFFAEFINSRVKFAIESTGVPQLTAPQISEYRLAVPPSAEQTAIAAMLSDMDAELLALEARRNKTRDLKQAMMQELLTGKTRLVPTGGVHV